jgi:hypothetical protein
MSPVLQHFLVGLQYLIAPGVVISFAVLVPSLLLARRLTPGPHRELAPLLFALSVCGYIIGVIAGNSAVPIAQTVVTGLLGLMAGIVSYVHTKESNKTLGVRTTASIGFISLLLSLFLGLNLGAAYKKRFEPFQSAQERYNVYFKEYAVPLCLEERKLAAAGKPTDAGQAACQVLEAGIRVAPSK